MADGRGGYRKPAKPAAVSGPGKLSRRTDGTQPMSAPTGMDYGDHKTLMDQERTAPMAGTPSTPNLNIAPPAQAAGGAGYQGPGLADPSQRPDEPITQGADIGAGDGPEALGMAPTPQQKPDGYMTQTLAQLSNTDTTGQLAKLYLMAQQAGA